MASSFFLLNLLVILVCLGSVDSQTNHKNLEKPSGSPLSERTPRDPSDQARSQPAGAHKAKFLLTTNGDQIKLYPMNPSHPPGSPLPALSDAYYLLKPRAFNSSELIFERLGRNILSDWLAARLHSTHSRRTLARDKPKKSILPPEGNLSREEDYEDWSLAEDQNQGGRFWRQPWITEVTYVLGERNFCRQPLKSNSNCLLVVWLDRRNQFVRMGSLNLEADPVILESPSKSKVVFLDELRPIDIVREFQRRLSPDCEDEPQVQSIASLGDHLSGIVKGLNLGGNYIFKTHLSQFIDGDNHNHERSLSFERVPEFGNNSGCTKREQVKLCHPRQRENLNPETEYLKNLNYDPNYNDWLFYLDTKASSLGSQPVIFAFNPKEQIIMQALEGPDGVFRIKSSESEMDQVQVASFAFHSQNIYLIDTYGKLVRYPMAGQDYAFYGYLPGKISSRSPFSIEVYEDLIFISDPKKKTLLVGKLENVTWISILQEEKITPTVKILLVEMKTILGFRVLSLDEKLPRPSAETPPYAKQLSLKRYHCFEDLYNFYLVSFIFVGIVIICILLRASKMIRISKMDEMKKKIVDLEEQ